MLHHDPGDRAREEVKQPFLNSLQRASAVEQCAEEVPASRSVKLNVFLAAY